MFNVCLHALTSIMYCNIVMFMKPDFLFETKPNWTIEFKYQIQTELHKKFKGFNLIKNI